MENIKELKLGDYTYLVTSNGQVFTTPHTVEFEDGHKQTYKMKELSQWIQTLDGEKKGYMMTSVKLKKNKPSRIYGVHVLVAMAFLPNPDNLPTVNHKDGNKRNNNVENLEWASYTDQLLHAWRIGLQKRNACAKKVFCVELSKTFNSTYEAGEELGIDRHGISAVCRGQYNSYKKYHFYYV